MATQLTSKHVDRRSAPVAGREMKNRLNNTVAHHASAKMAKLRASSTESGSDAETLDRPHTDGKTITPENGLAATHAIYHATGIYTARPLSQRNETIVSKPKSYITVFTVVLLVIPQSWKQP